tara:strand:+ start:1175 stop:1459 length:285 start_codon:yes stop_codon:yes gene_type:complete
MENRRIIRRPEVLSKLGISSTTLDRKIDGGLVTKPVSLGARSKGWPSNEIEVLITATVAGCNDQETKHIVSRLHTQRRLLTEGITYTLEQGEER